MPIIRFNELEYDRLIEIKQIKIKDKNRPEVTNKIRKALFFLKREGLVRTLDKIKSKRNKKYRLSSYLTKTVVSYQGENFINYSTQTSKEKNQFIIYNCFYEVDNGKCPEEDLSYYNQYCKVEIPELKCCELPIKKSEIISEKENKGVFIYGLGDYSRTYIAPNISKLKKLFCVDYSHQLATNYAQEYGYKHSGLIPEDSYQLIENTEYPLAIIATYHSDHSRIAKEVFEKNRNALIFIEKPPFVTLKDIDILIDLYNSGAKLEIGYNRRYIPICRTIKKRIFKDQKVITISVKEILINENHWYFWKNQGTRITGNLTHWIDLSNYWIDGHPTEVNLLGSTTKDETLSASILYSDGSLVNLTVSDKGNSLRGVQEHIEIRTKNETYFIEDFVKVTIYGKTGKKNVLKRRMRLKGHDTMYLELINIYQKKTNPFYQKEDVIKTSLTTFFMSKMYREDIRNLNVEKSIISYLKR